MNPEERLIHHRIQVAVKLRIVFILQRTGLTHPKRVSIVDDVRRFGFYFLSVFPFRLFPHRYGYRQEAAVFTQEPEHRILLQKLLAVVVDVKNNVRSALCFVSLFHRKGGRTVASPAHSFAIGLITFGHDFHFFGNHKRRIEAKAEMAYNSVGVVFIFL